MKLIIGIGLVAAACVAFYVALPRRGKVARFLKGDLAQSAYVVSIICAIIVGTINVVSGIFTLDMNGRQSTTMLQAKDEVAKQGAKP